MVINLLKLIYKLLHRVGRSFVLYWKRLFLFVLPNISFILSNRLNCKDFPNCNQIVLLTGMGKIEIGKGCCFGYKLGGFHRGGSIEIQPRYKEAVIKIGDNLATNNNVFFCAANYIEIRNDVLIGQNVTFIDHEAHGVDPSKRREVGEVGRIVVGNNVWLGNNVTILKNSEIGDNSIVATGAVVSGKFPPNVIIGGIPAKIIKELND